MSGTFGRGKMKRMQSTPLIMSKPNHKDNIAPVNLSPIFSTDASGVATTTMHSGLSALSTLYGEKIGSFNLNTEVNDFSHWLGPRITSMANNKNHLDGTYIEKMPEPLDNVINPSNKENSVNTELNNGDRFDPLQISVLSDILNKQDAPLLKSPDKISITVNKQSSVWLNASREYAKEPSIESNDKDMEELHTELDKILDQLQKLVT